MGYRMWLKDILFIFMLPIISVLVSIVFFLLLSHTHIRFHPVTIINRIYSLIVRFEDVTIPEQVIERLKNYADVLQESHPQTDSIKEWQKWYLEKRIIWKDRYDLWFEQPEELRILLDNLLDSKEIVMPKWIVEATLNDIREDGK